MSPVRRRSWTIRVAMTLDAFRRQSRRLLETGHQPRRLKRQTRYDGPRPFDVGAFPIRGPRRRTLSDGEQVACLVGELDDGRAVALVWCAGDLLILARWFGEAF